MKTLLTNQRQGFTLIETFVATIILVFAVIGPLGLMARAINDSNYAKNQITAFYLAQEGLELAINQRDKNTTQDIDPNLWLDGLDECTGDGCGLDIDRNDGNINVISSCQDIETEDCRLYIENDDGLKRYTYETSSMSEASSFYRLLKVEPLDEFFMKARLSATIRWANKDKWRTFSLSTVILNQDLIVGDGGGDDTEF